ncbi:hypothetical protein YQE_03249, partial [Dendroctonus ponderosae]
MDTIIEAVASLNLGYRIKNKRISMICYADHAAIIAENEDHLQRQRFKFHQISQRLNMTISINLGTSELQLASTRSQLGMLLVLLFTPLIPFLFAQQETTKPQLDKIQATTIIPGDIVLGGLFPVHERGEKTPCGNKIYNRGIQRMEAMMFAIDRINADPTILPNITLGAHIIDTCSRDTYALNQSLQFVTASALNNMVTANFECFDNSIPHTKNNYSGPVFGVVGGSYSSVSLQVANLLGLFRIPQISPASTAKALSDKNRFKYFARTVPPDTFQSSALVDIVKSVNWSYVSTVYSEGSYGEYGIEVFHREAQERNVCIATAEKVPSTADEKEFDSIIMKLKKKVNARGVILFTRAEDAR